MRKNGFVLIILLIAITLIGCTSNKESKGSTSESVVKDDKELKNEQVNDIGGQNEVKNIEEENKEQNEKQNEEQQGIEEQEEAEKQQEGGEKDTDNTNSELKEIDTDKYFILEDQSFDITLEPWGDVRFVSCIPLAAEGVNPLTDASFYLLKDNKIIYEFPSVTENNIRDAGGLLSVIFVMFRDIDGDNNKDIITGSDYITGAGPQGMIPYTEVRIYNHTGTEFTYNKELSEKINNNFNREITAEDVKKFLNVK